MVHHGNYQQIFFDNVFALVLTSAPDYFQTSSQASRLFGSTAMTASMKVLLIGLLAACATAVRVGAQCRLLWAVQLH